MKDIVLFYAPGMARKSPDLLTGFNVPLGTHYFFNINDKVIMKLSQLLFISLCFSSVTSLAQVHGKPGDTDSDRTSAIDRTMKKLEKKCIKLEKKRKKQEENIIEAIKSKKINKKASFIDTLDSIIPEKSVSTLDSVNDSSEPNLCSKEDVSTWKELLQVYEDLTGSLCGMERPDDHKAKVKLIIQIIENEKQSK